MISIVIPVINQSGMTIRCLQSIRSGTKIPHEIIWVDNGSTPDNVSAIKHQIHKPRVHCKLIRNSRNLGFIQATNQGIKEAEGDYIILLNNDTEVTYKWESKLIKPLIADPKVGAVGPVTQSRISWQEGRNLNVHWPKLKVPIYEKNVDHYVKKLEAAFPGRYLDVGIFPLSFFCCAFRRDTINKVGLLCEEMSIGLGDDDEYCHRLRFHGYKLMLSLETFVFHHHRTTFKELNLGLDSLRRHNLKVLRRKVAEMSKPKETETAL